LVFVDLTPLRDTALVLPAIAEAVGLRGGGKRLLPRRLATALAPKRLLLVLDNCEHVLAAAPALAALLAACPTLQILATSRAPLRLRGEQVLPVPPLAVPAPRDPVVGRAAELARVEAIALFVGRAQATDPAFALTEHNAAAVCEIVRRLDGLPLAIELAATWTRALPSAALLQRLVPRALSLTGGARDLPDRQQTLRGAIAWSYDLLPNDVQALFRYLAVFVGGFTLEAAEAATAEGGAEKGERASDVVAGIAALVEGSLLRQVETEGHAPRFAMLETVREFALEQLHTSGEAAATHARHANAFAKLAEQAEQGFHSPEELAWQDRCLVELGNLRAALVWSTGAGGDPAPGLRLAGALWWFWWRRGSRVPGRPQGDLPELGQEGWSWLERGLARDGAVPATVRAGALASSGLLAVVEGQGDDERALVRVEAGVALARTTGEPFVLARAQHFLGYCRLICGQAESAVEPLQEAVAGFQALGALGWTGMSLCFLSDAAAQGATRPGRGAWRRRG
jgi:predicted ATPase